MTYEKLRFDPPGGPTPEEISARLEALLKRTHELRRAQAPRTGDRPDEGPTWPPSDRDMAAVEVVDVPGSPSAAGGPMTATPLGGAAPPPRPDWSTLRQRDLPPGAETPTTPGWVWPVIVVLAVALTAETAYLAWTAPWAAATVPSVIAAPASAPVETVTEASPEPPAAPPAVPQAAPPQPAPAPREATTVPATPVTAVATSATTGAVRIESDPPGAIVTMEGRERGVTPITIERLRPGRHDVTLTRPGEGRLDLKVDVTAGQTTRLDASGRPFVQR